MLYSYSSSFCDCSRLCMVTFDQRSELRGKCFSRNFSFVVVLVVVIASWDCSSGMTCYWPYFDSFWHNNDLFHNAIYISKLLLIQLMMLVFLFMLLYTIFISLRRKTLSNKGVEIFEMYWRSFIFARYRCLNITVYPMYCYKRWHDTTRYVINK